MKIGIDLGTTYCAVARIDAYGKPEIIPNLRDESTTPSVIAVKDGVVLHGADAKELQENGYTEVASFFKRNMGNGDFTTSLCGQAYSPKELSSMLLKKLVEEAERVTGETVTGAVITVPAYFRDKARQDTIDAAKLAGIDVIGTLNEPTAAAFAYGVTKRDGIRNVLIYDLGGGTFDITLAEITDTDINILGCDGDHYLGGKNWDDAVARYLSDSFFDEFGMDLFEDASQLETLTVLAEKAKKRLTVANTSETQISYGGYVGKYTITLELFDSLTSGCLFQTKSIIENNLFSSFSPAKQWSDVDGIILVGGSTKMRQIKGFLRDKTGKEPFTGINPDEAVALGAAIKANLPSKARLLAGVPSERLIGGKALSDATAHSLGAIAISSSGDKYINDIYIKKNSPIPCAVTQVRELGVRKGALADMEVYLLQGEEESPLDNDVNAKYVFSGIKYVPSGKATIEITYAYDENTIIDIRAVQKDTGVVLQKRKEPVPDDMDWAGEPPAISPNNSRAVSVEIFLVCDLSGSMNSSYEEVKKAMGKFVSDSDLAFTKIGVIGVADRVSVLLRPTSSLSKIMKVVQTIDDFNCGACNRAQPFDTLLSSFGKNADMRIAVVLADGRWSKQDRAINAAKKCHAEGIEIIGMGFGSADQWFMREISSRDDFPAVTDLSNLSENFSAIARVISSSGMVAKG